MPSVAQYNGPSSISLYNSWKTHSVQIAAVACASTSMGSSFITIYWFCRMQKRFRHRLIMLLIFGDLMKAMWLFLLAAVSLARGKIVTESVFCQTSGFLVQFGTETSDYAVLVIALHSALQVFRPSRTIRSDGLYRYRHQVYIGALVIPAAMAGLAFINPRWGYMSQGPFCSLPLRPFWYRLALQWIPRYLIAIIILGLAIAIYFHVGFEFRALHNSMQEAKPSVYTTFSVGSVENNVGSGPAIAEYQVSQSRRGSSAVSMIGASRRASVVALVDSHTDFGNDSTRTQSIPESSQVADRSYTLLPLRTDDTVNTDNSYNEKENQHDPSRENSEENASPSSQAPNPHMQRQLAKQWSHIHRQLRLMFIYPLVYILVWLFPFINHCLTYQDGYARHPFYWLNLVTIICITLMGTIDCLIFSLREKPWRHIPTSDDTFLGSFIWWRKVSPQAKGAPARPSEALQRALMEANPETPFMQPEGWRESVMRAGRNFGGRTSGSSSDHARNQAGMARMRLEMEKEERRANMVLGEEEDVAKAVQRKKSIAMTGLDIIYSPEEERPEFGAQEWGALGVRTERAWGVVGCSGVDPGRK
ncbi:hypothetical protein BU23DRAFT_492045 [Bimuria novae-zelandiae CBS 107.79]|uniref:G protein-coupled glucose receptor regulating Gpa2-domain-containing protein n=1 Tax=Bimuria novae-zelandiae CBS 107.79 TaxID=1447943 RepID=A0A6A5UNU1_9PLEO|nr:hypothetical protein BU23DRAFT_492045 [Bimuria novae-zelandiae CBS 107.79]